MFTEQSVAVPSARERNIAEHINLMRLTEEDNISYLTTFKRIMAANKVNREHCTFQLAPHHTMKAQQAYAALPPDDAKVYDTLKEPILWRCNSNKETYYQWFHKF